MLKNGKEICSCPHIDCKRNGKCDECSKFHGNNKTYCQKLLKRKLSGDSHEKNQSNS